MTGAMTGEDHAAMIEAEETTETEVVGTTTETETMMKVAKPPDPPWCTKDLEEETPIAKQIIQILNEDEKIQERD